ncbi:response regulator [Lacipirellula parvula]|uniref:Response regulatory domain-containing protein n=1 Tax=Lacipirellula parvula TaxID=2650471 RepID=A0A5K7X6C5_9BACT|nr:response regulator [Lacipirellula parvula]BBO32274.1 hypothetical protein PLANPX_1886 [Lacipirellula parvula]
MTCSLLVVDDEPDLLFAMTQLLHRRGYRVAGASTPQQALAVISRREIQIALLDLSLTGMDGIELMRRMKRMQPDLQVIILSGYDYPLWRAREEGAFGVITKPCVLALLEGMITHACERGVDEYLPFDSPYSAKVECAQ